MHVVLNADLFKLSFFY